MPGPPSRASRPRRAALIVCSVATVAALGFSVPAANAARSPKSVVKLTPGEVTVYKVGDAPETIPEDTRTAVLATLASYIKAATVKPLQTGKVDDATLAAVLAPGAAARLGGPDRAVLLDEGLPRATAKVKVAASPVALTGLADDRGAIVVVTANLDANATTKTARGKLGVKRSGEMVLEPDNGTWKITGYTLTVDRTGKGAKTTTATTVPAAPAAPTPATASR